MAEAEFSEDKFAKLQGKVMGDVGGAVGLCMAYIGDQAGEARLTKVLHEAGFSHVRRATETPTNMVLEATA